MSIYNRINTFGTGKIYDYFDLTGAVSIKTNYNETSTDGAKLKSATSLNSNLKHTSEIGYKINNADIYNLYVPKCYVFTGDITTTISVPTITNRIVFFMQAPGGFGASGSTSPDNPGGSGGSGALYFGYINRLNNYVTSISLRLFPCLFNQTNAINNTFTFTGGTSLTLTCGSGANAPSTNVGGSGGGVSVTSTVGLTAIDYRSGNAGSNNLRTQTTPPYTQYPNNTNSYSTDGPTVYYPLTTASHGYGGPGGSSNGSSGVIGGNGIAAVWFLL